ncbi:AEC family transporter [Bifidobacterium olomucense]|uniref:Permease n=1 Tax=Bifidobacterium olomucense TaxID=2675324 RepID=A0A7Y0HW87_9BIFI|nr:permease [Bifidobacterium sp. DSM 109959]
MAWLLRLHGSRSHIFQASLIFGNAGFIGIPLVMALFAHEGAIYVALMSLVDQALLWTYGVWLCEPVSDHEHLTPQRTNPFASLHDDLLNLAKRFVNPAFIGVMIALALILLGIRVPELILKPLHTIGGMATPMSLIYLGGLFALTRWWGVLKRYELYVGLVTKMIAFPLGFYALLTALAAVCPWLPVTHDMILMMTVIAGLPTMTTIAMFTGRKNNMPDYAVGFVLVSTLFSLVSLTIVSAIVF